MKSAEPKESKKMVLTNERTGHSISIHKEDFPYLQALQESANDSLNGSSGIKIFAGLATFVFLFEPIGAIAAGTLAAMPVLIALRNAITGGPAAVYIDKTGNFAHRLNESQLVRLTKMVGVEAVVYQLTAARDAEQKLTNSAKRYLELSGQQSTNATLEILFDQTADKPEVVQEEILTLEALPFNELEQGQEGPTVPEKLEPKTVTATKPKVDTALSRLLASPFQSRAIFGGQRTGKSNLVSVASSELAKSGAKIYHINLLSYTGKGDEDSQYVKHCEQSIRSDFSHETDSNRRTAVVADCIKMVQAWWDYEGEAILIFDEYAYAASVAVPETGALLTLIADKLSAIASSGMKREHSLWALSPTMVASEMQDAGKRIKSLKPVMVAIAPGHTEEWQGQQLTFDSSLHTEVNRNFGNIIPFPSAAMTPGESRIAYIDGSWCGLGTNGKKKEEPQQGSELVDLLAKIANEIKKQAAKKEDGHITVRAAAQCLPSDRRKELYPKMPEYCKALAEMYPEEFKVFQGKADEWRVAHLKSPTFAEAA